MKVSAQNPDPAGAAPAKPNLEVAGGHPERASWPEFLDDLLRTALLFAVIVAVVAFISRKAAQWAG